MAQYITIMKNMNKPTCINCTFMKIDILAHFNPVNNFQLIKEVNLFWAKCSNYALK